MSHYVEAYVYLFTSRIFYNEKYVIPTFSKTFSYDYRHLIHLFSSFFRKYDESPKRNV